MTKTAHQPHNNERLQLKRVATGTVTGFAAMGCFSGLSPKAPGTMGTALAWCLMWPLSVLPEWALMVWVALAAIIGVVICQRAAQALGVHDHPAIVWDEFVGMWLVLLLIPQTVWIWGLGFVLFRVFDILKPWPIGWLDERLAGGIGIMADDILAGLYAIAVVWLGIHLWPAVAAGGA